VNLSEAIATTRRHIDAHWEQTFRDSRGEAAREFPLPRPHTVPSTDPCMWLFFYWDTYFTNLGLLRQNRLAQAINNADNVIHCIEQIGFVPNISVRIALNRSQIPVSAVLFEDIFRHTRDLAWLRRAYAALGKEYAFWMALRLAPNGLNTCGTHADPVTLANFYDVIKARLADIPAEPVARLQYLRHKMAECEVWDFNPRFNQHAADFNPVDTNVILYQFETIAGDFARTLGLPAEETVWRDRAAHRCALIDRYLWNEAKGFYFDYDWAHGRQGAVVSAAPYFALWSGVCSDAQAAALAQFNLGAKYDNGDGVLKDSAEAVKWYRKAAEQGDAGAQGNLAAMNADGDGVTQDNNEATKWFRVAAEHGNAAAQYNIGYRYAYGIGVEKTTLKRQGGIVWQLNRVTPTHNPTSDACISMAKVSRRIKSRH